MNDININRQYGTKWFTFYTKVRPWLSCIGILTLVSDFYQFSEVYFDFWWLLLYFAISVAESIVSIVVFVKSYYDYKVFVRFVKGVLFFETISIPYTIGVQQYLSSFDLSSALISSLVCLAFTYFVWYRLNVKYFEKRIMPYRNISKPTQNNHMKRFLSWIVLCLISWLISLLTSLVVGIGSYILGLINELSTFWKIVAFLFGGTAFLSFIFLPVHYGYLFAIFASETIKESKKGMRYIVFPVCMLITNIIYIIIGLTEHTFYLNTIIMCIYYILLIISGRGIARENLDNEEAKNNTIYKSSTYSNINTPEYHAPDPTSKNEPCYVNNNYNINRGVNNYSPLKETSTDKTSPYVKDQQLSLFDYPSESEIEDIMMNAEPLSEEDQKQIEMEIKATKFVNFNLYIVGKGHSQIPLEITKENEEFVHKWLDRETNSIYCIEDYKDGSPNYYCTTKEIFDNMKEKFENI